MNPSEIQVLIKYVRGQWPHYTINDGTPVAYERLLGDLAAETVLAAIDEYATKGERYAPSPGELRRLAVLRLLPEIPQAGEAWGMFMHLHFGHGGRGYEIPEGARPLLDLMTERLGGWDHIHATWLVENEMADRAHFLRMWNALTETEIGRATAIGAGARRELGDRFSERADFQ